MLVTLPLASLVAISVLGSRSALHPTSPIASSGPASLTALRVGAGELTSLARGVQPTPASVASPTAPNPAPVAAPPAQPAPAPPAPAPPRPVAAGVGGAAGAEFGLVNQDRASNGVAPLAYSAALARVAQYRAQDMLNRDYFSHYDPVTGQLAFAQLLQQWGIPYRTAGENIAWSTNPSMAGINTMFMNSPEHRANILNPAFHQAGIGVASNGVKTMVVEVFSN